MYNGKNKNSGQLAEAEIYGILSVYTSCKIEQKNASTMVKYCHTNVQLSDSHDALL
jgi:hypothetical protein